MNRHDQDPVELTPDELVAVVGGVSKSTIRWPPEQMDLFGPVSEAEEEPLSRIERYGWHDANTGGWNHYSRQLSGERLEAYLRGYRRRLETVK